MEFAHALDISILRSINELSGIDPTLDRIVLHIADSPIFKGTVPMMIFWGLWFVHPNGGHRTDYFRARLVSIILAACVTIFMAKLLALVLPFRDRPVYSDISGINIPHDATPPALDSWSSMPSDHASLFFALAVGLLSLSRAWGVIALLHAFFIVCLPRVFAGWHYPGDILVGAAVGVAAALLFVPLMTKVLLQRSFLQFANRHSSLFHAAMFAVTFQVATMFDSLRELASGAAQVLF